MDKKYYYDLEKKLNFEDVLLDALPNPIYYKDVKGDFIRCNTRFSELTNTCKKEIIGKSAYEFFPKSAADRNKLIDKEIMKTLQPYEDEVHFIMDNGEVRYYNLSKAVCLDKAGVVKGIVCIMTDITQRIKEKEILIQQSKFAEMGEMIASIAHQWNEPLVELSAQVQKMELFYSTNQMDKKKVSDFVSNSMIPIQYMSETLNDFRNFLKPSTIKEEFDLKKAISEIFDIVGKQIFYFNIKINFDYRNDEDFFIVGYKNQLKQVMLNIINNAKNKIITAYEERKFDGIITIRLTNTDNLSIIEIIDNAGPIKEDIIDQIFDPFFTTKENGTGFGLYMAKTIIEDKMSGKIAVRNDGENVIFSIKIPKTKKS
ncbi:PAS domain-containing protein [Poseidonibacter ostreae]|uniref:two-component system sensor histidine kinase NtrB n=1 Tax=Poseidonibacter ostreae TaxID=2654171 RepID=UPI00126455FA|nr:PAS domain-containing sensor histidine kinase [Poseidonibacter ostreae]KAB7887735.1 PAS domain-containing protein [Poseidonibacter ostreae]